MKAKLFVSALLTCGFVFGMALYADMSGKWSGSLNTPNGVFPLDYVFKVEGTKLTGSVTTPQGDLALTDGKTDGKNFSFNVDVNGALIKTDGKYYAEGDTVALDVDFGGAKSHSKLIRAK
jgi:hypothetical protein